LIKLGVQEGKISVVSNGVDINRFKPGLEASAIIAKYNLYNKKVLFTVSRLRKYKGHDTVISLMPQLLKKTPSLIYVIGGSGKDKEHLESIVKKLDLQNSVIFAGPIDEINLPLYYNACDLYIMLTRDSGDTDEFEGFGLVFLEANACEKPVIGARTGGIPDAIVDEKTGYLVDPNNPQEITDRIYQLLENKELSKRIGEEGRNRIIREGLIWESIAKKIRDILFSEVKK
jgi:phosphatidylinositol alpha-1,6-mannosyltransferase